MPFISLSVIQEGAYAVISSALTASIGVLAFRAKIFDSETRTKMSKIIISYCLPAYLLVTVGEALTFDVLKSWYILLLNAVVEIVAAWGVGALIGYAPGYFRPVKRFRRGLIAAIGCGNHGLLPLVLMASVCKDVDLSTTSKTREEVCVQGAAFIGIELIFLNVGIWGLGYSFLTAEDNGRVSPADEETVEEAAAEDPQPRPPDPQWKRQLRAIFSPPTFGVLAGILIGVIAPLKSVFFGEDAALRFIVSSLEVIGPPAIGVMMFVLGGNMAERGPSIGGALRKRDIASVTFARLLLLPIIGFFVVKFLFEPLGIPDEPLFKFALLIQWSQPMAVALTVICQLVPGGISEDMASLAFWHYLLSFPLLAIAVAFMLEQ